ncbi:MAG TPA: hypothetical protein DCO89_02615, partial [Clostridiales bacterium]|nr:hypothetical protein [Clostridiales bacterium]
EIRTVIKTKLKELVSAVKDVNNLSIVLNGDLLYDFNKGYIMKKNYSAETFAEIQQLCEILKPVADKIVAINYGKMEEGIMNVEKDRALGRYSKGKNTTKGLANYAIQTSQLEETQAYEPYNKEEMRTRKLAIQNSQVNQDNQKVLNKAYEDFVKKLKKDKNALDELDEVLPETKKYDAKKIKEALVKKLRLEHKILDISNEDDRKLINAKYPLAYIDLRLPNDYLIGNVFCKLLGVNNKNVTCNHIINAPSIFKIDTANGDKKVVYAYYTPSLAKFSSDISAKLNRTVEPPDIVLVNNAASNTGESNEYTTQERKNYLNKNNARKTKDVVIINSGSFRYSRLYTNNKVTTPKIYKIGEVDPIYPTVQPKTSINYKPSNEKRLVIHKYEPESINRVDDHIKRNIEKWINKSHIETINNYYDTFRKTKTPNHVESEANRFAESLNLEKK